MLDETRTHYLCNIFLWVLTFFSFFPEKLSKACVINKWFSFNFEVFSAVEEKACNHEESPGLANFIALCFNVFHENLSIFDGFGYILVFVSRIILIHKRVHTVQCIVKYLLPSTHFFFE